MPTLCFVSTSLQRVLGSFTPLCLGQWLVTPGEAASGLREVEVLIPSLPWGAAIAPSQLPLLPQGVQGTATPCTWPMGTTLAWAAVQLQAGAGHCC